MHGPPIWVDEFPQRNWLAAVALTALLWDWAISLEDEFQYIWKSSWITNRWVYLMSRYLGITSQLVGNIIMFSNGQKPIPEGICRTWICFESAASLIFFGLIELIQVLQIYAFYHKKPNLRSFLTTWFCAEIGGMGYILWYIGAHLDFDPSCCIIRAKSIGIVYVLIAVTLQAIILFVLFWRRRVVAPGALEDVPVAYIVLRDGSLVFLVLCGIMGLALVYSTKRGHPLFVTPALSAIYSIATCRMALNLQSMKRQNPRRDLLPNEIHLTTLPASTENHRRTDISPRTSTSVSSICQP